MGRSLKENERRRALHPAHLDRIDPDLRSRIFIESGYGEQFGVSDERLGELVAGVRTHEQLVAECDVILQPKPVLRDVAELREGQVLWGWPHCVQDTELTQHAIDRGLTLVAFEAMNHWGRDGSFSLHVLHTNNELAGYASVLHALQLTGSTGHYGPRRSAAVIGFGATARGAVTALTALGVSEVDVLTRRQVAAVASPIHTARMLTFGDGEVELPGGVVPLAPFLGKHDIIVNCVLQDTDAPLMFLGDDDLEHLTSGTVIVDVSCDAGMGFAWATPTSFADPVFVIGDGVTYYGVDHSPSYLWASATWEISQSLLPFIRGVLAGPAGWDADPTIARAIEIRDGVVQNPAILSFQGRSPEPPHPVTTA